MSVDKLKFLDLFAGVGGIRLGMEQAGHECVGWVEWDKFARLSYQAIHNTKGEWTAHDITTVRSSDIPRANIWCFGFPCQDISVAGKQKGFTGNRSSLFFTVTRLIRDIAEENRPELLLIENVKNLLSINGGWDFAKLQIELDEIGYDCEWDVLNSKEVVPQHRERIFIIGHLRGRSTRKVFPIEGSYGQVNQNNIKGVNDSKKIREQIGFESTNRFYDVEGISPCLNTMSGGGREPKIMVRESTKRGYAITEPGDSINFEHPNSKTRRGRVGKGVANTLTTSCNQGTLENYRIRKLTPLECWRLQGFPDWAFDRASQVNSDSQLYKQAGNSVTVPVIYEIAKQL